MISHMEKGSKGLLMEAVTKDNLSKGSNKMKMDCINGQMERSTEALLKKAT